VRALQQGIDPPPPRLWRDKRGGACGDSFKSGGYTALLFRP